MKLLKEDDCKTHFIILTSPINMKQRNCIGDVERPTSLNIFNKQLVNLFAFKKNLKDCKNVVFLFYSFMIQDYLYKQMRLITTSDSVKGVTGKV